VGTVRKTRNREAMACSVNGDDAPQTIKAAATKPRSRFIIKAIGAPWLLDSARGGFTTSSTGGGHVVEGRLRKPTAVRGIVLGDERGDSGKSTAALPLAIALGELGTGAGRSHPRPQAQAHQRRGPGRSDGPDCRAQAAPRRMSAAGAERLVARAQPLELPDGVAADR